MTYLFDEVSETRANLKYMVSLWTAEQQTAAKITTPSGADILTYDDINGVISDYYFKHVLSLYISRDASPLTPEQGATMVYNKYMRWRNQRMPNILRAWRAMTEEYDPLFNYDRHEDAAKDTEEIRHGKKLSTSTDITRGTNTDLKESRNMDTKDATASDLKTEHATSVKASTASDLKSTVNTDVTETEGATTKQDKRPTWLADDQVTAGEVITPGTKHTTGAAANNYTETSGTAAGNYTETVGTAAGNYDRASGLAENNYTTHSGTAANNYTHSEGAEADNYIHETADVDDNYTQESGKTETDHNIGARHMYGNIGTTKSQEMIADELKIRRVNFVRDLVAEWAESISYTLEVMG